MKQKLPEIYKNRAHLLKLSLDLDLSDTEFLKLVTPMEGKSEEEKEKMAQEIINMLTDGSE